MKTKEVLVVGAGIAGCAVALALAKRGVHVTIVTSSHDQRIYHASFITQEDLEKKIEELQSSNSSLLNCSRAQNQLVQLAKLSVEELIEPHYLIDRNGNIELYRCLQEQLKQFEQIEWLASHTFVDLITLDRYSVKPADQYKRPCCLGIITYNHEEQKFNSILAKETILATGGATSLFPHSSHSPMARGEGLAIAHRAGVRLLNMENMQFHPLGLFERNRPCFPLPLEILTKECRLHSEKTAPLELGTTNDLLSQLYDELLEKKTEHLWLDLTLLDSVQLKNQFPTVDAYCLNHGWNIAKDPLPVVPIATYTGGGIAVDRTGQTNMQRLRAIGEVACTGLFCSPQEESLYILESLTWAVSCAEDLTQYIHKLIYYFPPIKKEEIVENSSIILEDWEVLKHIMWSYFGIKKDRLRIERGLALLEQLRRAQLIEGKVIQSLESIQLYDGIQTAILIGQAAYQQINTCSSVQLAAYVG